MKAIILYIIRLIFVAVFSVSVGLLTGWLYEKLFVAPKLRKYEKQYNDKYGPIAA